MKYTTATFITLLGMSNALPHSQFEVPSFTLPSFSMASGNPLSGLFGGGNGFSIPNLPSPTGKGSSGTNFDWSSLFGGRNGLGAGPGSGVGTATPTQAVAIPTKTSTVEAPSSTGTTNGTPGGSGNAEASCTPQSTGRGSSETGVTDKNCCTDVTVIFARGTGEPGNVGFVSGPPMIKALRQKLGNDRVTVQGVDYAASSAGNSNLGADGGKLMADLVASALSQCPNTKIIVSGYSQGAMVVHNAFQNGLSASKVSGSILFGDPLKRQAIGDLPTDKIKQFCGTSDQICGGGGDGGATGGHTSYGSSADAAATFAIQVAGLA